MIHEIRDVIELNCVFFSLGIEKILRSLMTCGEHSTHKRDQPEKGPPPSVVCYLTEYELMLNFLELRNYACLRILSELCGKATFHIYYLYFDSHA